MNHQNAHSNQLIGSSSSLPHLDHQSETFSLSHHHPIQAGHTNTGFNQSNHLVHGLLSGIPMSHQSFLMDGGNRILVFAVTRGQICSKCQTKLEMNDRKTIPAKSVFVRKKDHEVSYRFLYRKT